MIKQIPSVTPSMRNNNGTPCGKTPVMPKRLSPRKNTAMHASATSPGPTFDLAKIPPTMPVINPRTKSKMLPTIMSSVRMLISNNDAF